MRKEGIIFLGIIIASILCAHYGPVAMNALIYFLLAGIVPGTQLVFSSSFMLTLMSASLVVLVGWPLRQRAAQILRRRDPRMPVAQRVTRRRFKHIQSL